MDCSLPGSSVHGILQARILECVAISFFRGSSQPRNQTRVSCIAGRFFTDWATREAQHHGIVLTSLTFLKTYLQIQSHFEVPGVRVSTYEFWEDTINPFQGERKGLRKREEGREDSVSGKPVLSLVHGVRGSQHHLSNHRVVPSWSKEVAFPITLCITSLARPHCVSGREGS